MELYLSFLSMQLTLISNLKKKQIKTQKTLMIIFSNFLCTFVYWNWKTTIYWFRLQIFIFVDSLLIDSKQSLMMDLIDYSTICWNNIWICKNYGLINFRHGWNNIVGALEDVRCLSKAHIDYTSKEKHCKLNSNSHKLTRKKTWSIV